MRGEDTNATTKHTTSRKGETMDIEHTPECMICGEEFDPLRWSIGYKTCMPCGDKAAKQVKHCVVNMNKAAYMAVTDLEILKQLNPKRTT
jgi:ribosomal protein L37AE/L43A